MDNLETVLSNPYQVIISLIALTYIAKEGYNAFRFWKERADGYHQRESKKEDFEKQVSDIAVTSEKHTKTLDLIRESIKGFNMQVVMSEQNREKEMLSFKEANDELIKKLDEERKLDTIANCRAWLYQLYGQFKDKPTLTSSEFETFDDLAKRYLEAGGNNVFQEKIIPSILSKPIDDKKV